MCMIFDRFETRSRAEEYAAHIANTFGLKTQVFDSQDEMEEPRPPFLGGDRPADQMWDVFPSALIAPIVLVDRTEFDIERKVEDAVKEFAGVYCGT